MERKRRIAVIGAGPAGLTAAYALARHGGVEVHVFEASDQVGGMGRSLELWGQTVDLGPHRFFSSDRRINELWLEVVGRDYHMVDRQTRIHFAGKFFQYPLQPLNALANLGPVEALRCALSYAKTRLFSAPPSAESFEDWVVGRFGRRLFEIFFKSYSEKLWGIPCTELDSDFAAQRIKKLSFLEIARNALALGGRNRHASLVDRFAYPDAGSGIVYERMAEYVRRHGGRVELNQAVARVHVENGRARGLTLASGERHAYDAVVSTMPLTKLLLGLPGVPTTVQEAARRLTFRNTILVFLHVDAENLFPDNWLYVQGGDYRMGRITNFRNWGPVLNAHAKTTILCLEYWANTEEALWSQDERELAALAEGELRRTGLIGDARVLGAEVVRVPNSYPVYRRGYRADVTILADYLRGVDGLLPIGRYGAFKYNNQDHSILMGLLAADNLLGLAHHDLWAVNTDYESYQEQASIGETGLETKPTP